MADVGFVEGVHCPHQIGNKLIELPYSPIPKMLPFEVDDWAEICIDTLHHHDVATGFRKNVHTCADDVIIDELMQVLRGQFGDLFGEVGLAEDAGEGVAALVGVGTDEEGLLFSFGVDEEDPSFEDVSFFHDVFDEDALGF